jgi:hypothetical protein
MSRSPGSWEAPAASGSMRVHQSITQSDLEKKRWPPMSMRLPLYSTDCDRPPTLRVASSTTTSRMPASASSQAAVRPAGPAPMITTRARKVSMDRFSYRYLVNSSSFRVAKLKQNTNAAEGIFACSGASAKCSTPA